MSQSLITPDYWEDAKAHLSSADPILGALINQYQGEMLKARGDGFYTLARSIVGQQISVKAADSVWNKLVCHPALVAGSVAIKPDPAIRPDDMQQLTDEELRSCGLSGQKVKYLRAVAEYFESPPDFATLDDDALLASLTSINGVGKWTAEMFMIFHLLKPDVFPVDDIGLLKAIGLRYGNGEKATKEQALKIGEPWKPYRTIATWYLWRSLDPVPVEY